MAKKRTSEPPPPPNLLIPRAEAAEKISAQIEKGRELIKTDIYSHEFLEKVKSNKTKWVDYTAELLKRIFDQESIANEFRYALVSTYRNPSDSQRIQSLKNEIAKKVTVLESLLERLDLIPELNTHPSTFTSEASSLISSEDIFVVHGHDEAAKESVSRFIERLGLHAVILHEQPNAGRTIIEKFEHHSKVAFAVVLLTPDDVGASRNTPDELKLRARQNVIFELGYFVGKIGRNRVCALYKEGVELPSDIHGVLYVPMDSSGGWRLMLAKELKQAGFEVDLNRAL